MFSSVVSCFFEANDGLRKQLHPHNCDCRQCVYVYACVSALKHVENTGTCVEPAIPKAASSHYELNEFQRKSKSYARSVCIVCTDLGHFGHFICIILGGVMYLPKSVDIANKRPWQTAWTVFASVMHLRPVCALPSDCPNSFALQQWGFCLDTVHAD